MTTPCAILDREERARDYARGALTASALESFEVHLVGCAECQAEARLAMVVRESLRHESTRPARRGTRWPLTVGVAGAAATIVFALLSRGNARLAPLGAVTTPPAYLGVAVRGAAADSFEQGMRLYNAGTWNDAARALASAAHATPGVADASWFFAGAAALMAGKDADAIASFGRVIAMGPNPYLNEARYYRAKARLRTGNGADALTDLRLVESESVIGAQASALVDSVLALVVR